MKKITPLLLGSCLLFIGAGCASFVTTKVPPASPQPGEVTLDGTYNGMTRSDNPDAGPALNLMTQTYGQVEVSLPGFIQCKTSQMYVPSQIGEKIEVRGNYADGSVHICSLPSYYIKQIK